MPILVTRENQSVYAHRLLSRFSVESKEYFPSFYEQHEVTWKWEKPNDTGKTYTYVLRSLRLQEPLINLQK